MAIKPIIHDKMITRIKEEGNFDPKSFMLEICQEERVTREDVYDTLWGSIDDEIFNIFYDRHDQELFVTDTDIDSRNVKKLTNNNDDYDFRLPEKFWEIDGDQITIDCPFCDEELCLDEDHNANIFENLAENASNAFDSPDIPSEKMDRNCDVRIDTKLMRDA